MSDAGVVGGTLVLLPSLGADMDVGSVLEWRVGIGDRVERGDVVALISTEKSDIDVESWDTGVVTELIATIGQELEVGSPLLRLNREARASVQQAVTSPGPGKRQPTPTEPTDDRVPASPLARRRAADRHVSLHGIDGTGPGGAIVAADLERLPGQGAEPAATPDEPAGAMRRAIAERMTRSNREIPHYRLEQDVDMTPALEWLAGHNADLAITDRAVPAALFACAVARAAGSVGELNGTWEGDHLALSGSVDLAIVISLRSGGLVMPTVAAADQLGLADMMSTMRDMVTRARRGRLLSRWMAPSTIAITNLGDNGADRVAGVIFPPHIALIGFGRMSQRPWVVNDLVVPRSMVTATLVGDHRASDGADGSRFLAAVEAVLADPEQLRS